MRITLRASAIARQAGEGGGSSGVVHCVHAGSRALASPTADHGPQPDLEQRSKRLRRRQAGAAGARNRHVPPYTPVP
ncbi:hypothetical protein EIP98_02670, partial [Xanthomonas campestris pv. raphani]